MEVKAEPSGFPQTVRAPMATLPATTAPPKHPTLRKGIIMNTTTDIFNAETRAKLTAAGDNTASAMTRMSLALGATLGHVFAGVDNDLEPEHRAARQAKRRAKSTAGRKANVARRSR